MAKLFLALTSLVPLLSAQQQHQHSRQHRGVDEAGKMVDAYVDVWQRCEREEDPHSAASCRRVQDLHEPLKRANIPPDDLTDLLYLSNQLSPEPETRSDHHSDEDMNHLQKRVIMRDDSKRWDGGIVPYIFTDEIGAGGRNEIRRVQLDYERLTCLRFVPYTVDEDGVTTNEKYGIRPGHLRYITNGACQAPVGKSVNTNGQWISCCGFLACLHEHGHSLGLHHEQQTTDPDKELLIRTNSNGTWYKRLGGSYISLVGYDPTTVMHYGSANSNDNPGGPYTKLFPELRINDLYSFSGQYYLMMEVSVAHKCGDLHCADFPLTCHNDGYLTLVDDHCACRCVPGLDPETGCTSIINSKTAASLQFPGGSYALLQSKSGCGDSTAETGTITLYNDGGNAKSRNFNNLIAGEISGTKVELNFCVTEHSTSDVIWPTGNYCVLRKGGTCPEHFTDAYVQYDDNPKDGNSNSHTGALPDGVFGENTRLEYCCRDNGFTFEPIFLPNRNPFILFKNGKRGCQKVRGMHVYGEEYYQVKSSSDEGIADRGGASNQKSSRYLTNLCYYEPATIDCGEYIELTKDNPTVTFDSPDGQELECTWFIKAPEGQHVLLNFDNFNIDSKDRIEIRAFKPGVREGTIYRGTKMDKTITSFKNTLVVHMSTYNLLRQTDSSFTATARLQLNEDLCYDAREDTGSSNRGTSYAGNVNFTRWFEPCLPWAEMTHCKYHPFNIPSDAEGFTTNTLLEGNFCRNPDRLTGAMPWCYTSKEFCERNYCDPCLSGRVFDAAKDCNELAELGICTNSEYKVQAMSKCAKTCGFDLSAYGIPDKVSSVSCGSPPPVPDGHLVKELPEGYANPVGSTVTYKCTTSEVTRTSVCLTTGQWSPVGFVCEDVPPGWRVDLEQRWFYRVYSGTKLPFWDAQNTCKSQGGSLATARTASQNAFIQSLVTDNTWLGLYDGEVEGEWHWADTWTQVDGWTNWADGQPNNYGNQDCGIIYKKSDWKWADVKCSGSYGFICMKKMPDLWEPPTCADFWDGCRDLFQTNPAMCVQREEFATRMCPFTCGKCQVDATSSCDVLEPPQSLNSMVYIRQGPFMKSVSRGNVVEYTCKVGYSVSGGDSVRGCQADGQLTGQDLVCSPNCPEGWISFKSGQKCIGYIQDPVDHRTANLRCEEMGGYLNTPKTLEDNEQIRDIANGKAVWVGLDDMSVEGRFVWKDSSPLLGWDNWKLGAPNNDRYGEDGVLMIASGEWNDVPDGDTFNYVCEVPKSVIDESATCIVDAAPNNGQSSTEKTIVSRGSTVRYWCDDGYIIEGGDPVRTCLINGRLSGEQLTCVKDPCPECWQCSSSGSPCYRLFHDRVSYYTAVDRCAALDGGYLAMPKTEDANELIVESREETDLEVWVGLDDRVRESGFQWVDGDVPNWLNWAPGQPSWGPDGPDCVTQRVSGQWNDVFCGSLRPFVCQATVDLSLY